jgi:hypothetical protein
MIDKERMRLNAECREIGLRISKEEETIHRGRLALRGLLEQDPRDEEAISERYEEIRKAHHERHNLEHPRRLVSQEIQLIESGTVWPPGPDPWG